MTNLFLYIVESSLCLIVLYLGYFLLFKKETYFNFIRIYLLLSLLLALILPLVSLNINVSGSNLFVQPVEDIGKFKSYYEHLIFQLDPEFSGAHNTSTPLINQTPYKSVQSSGATTFIKSNAEILTKTIVIIYLAGLLFCVIRFSYLLFWIWNTIKKNKVSDRESYKLVEVKRDLPAFSFLRYIFINPNTHSDSEINQIIAHEKTHIIEKHSLDLLMVHLIGIFHWFNPVIWRLSNAFKTTHEYIADRKVVEQGYKLLDYQSLLLRQLISIRSVELVNNFNLLSIKKRIAMMNKMKSGFLSKAKAIIALPFILAAFFLIADLSCSVEPNPDNIVGKNDLNIELPVISHARSLDEFYIGATFSVNNSTLVLNGEVCAQEIIEEAVKRIAENRDEDFSKLTVLLEIDGTTKMSKVDDLRQLLRQNQLYKIAFISKSDKNTEGIRGLPQKLPPVDAKLLNEEEVKKEGIAIYTLSIDDNTKGIDAVKRELRELIETNEKYVIKQMHSDETEFSSFIKFTEVVYETVFELRNEMAQRIWKTNYADLEKEKQKEIQQNYPLTLMSLNNDRDQE